MVANTYLEGTYAEVYPDVTRDEEGLRKLFRQFSFPGGIPSHAARKRRARSMRVASSATRLCMRMAPRSITLI